MGNRVYNITYGKNISRRDTMNNDGLTMKEILERVRKLGIDELKIVSEEGADTIDIKKSLEQGKVTLKNDTTSSGNQE